MQVYEGRRAPVQRDMDLIRDILLFIEGNPDLDGTREVRYDAPEEMGITGHSMDDIAYHLGLLTKAGFVDGEATLAGPCVSSLTWQGHEFLDNIKSDTIWASTKKRLSGLPGVAMSVVAAVAEAEIKKLLKLP